ncbi:PASTA domain-containing protein [Actinoplanes sp. NPDC051346]|uniref:PASTA domain-containing protein n=1 Tax=Actinoplanes sp. NPDC051346 TaxID=3155048 RepID=UPI0034259405
MSDDTGEFFPFRDEASDEGKKHPNGRPRKGDDSTGESPRTPAESDHTETLPAADDATAVHGSDADEATAVHGSDADDATAVHGSDADDATAVYRAGGDDATTVHQPAAGGGWADDDQVWAGRAGVRRPDPASDATRTDWALVPRDEPRGKWWMPIAVGLVALLLLSMLSWGVWLILQSTGDDDEELPVPVRTTSAAPAPTTKPTTKPPSTAPTTVPPTSAPPSTPSDITIPALRGLSVDEARGALNRSGLNYRLRYLTSTEAPPGTVIDSDPSEGKQVPGDTIINLIVASAPTPSSAPSDGADED